MNSYERAIKWGRWLAARKRLLLVAVMCACVAALLLSTPFRLVYHRWWLYVAALVVAAAGLVLRMAAGVPLSVRRGDQMEGPLTLPDIIDVGGVFSVMRFPGHAADILLAMSLVIYTGALWFMPVAMCLCLLSAYCVVFAQEHALQSRYGDVFNQWCRTTYSITPALLNWRPWNVRPQWWKLPVSQARTAFGLVAGFCLIDLCKHWVVDFAFTIDLPWLIAFGVAFIFVFIPAKRGGKQHQA